MKDHNFPNFVRQADEPVYTPNKESADRVDESLDRIDEPVYNVDRKIFPRWLNALVATAVIGTAYAVLSFSSSYTNKQNYKMLNTDYSNVVEVARYNPEEASKEAGALVDKIHSLQRDANITPSRNVLVLMKKIESDFEAQGFIMKH